MKLCPKYDQRGFLKWKGSDAERHFSAADPPLGRYILHVMFNQWLQYLNHWHEILQITSVHWYYTCFGPLAQSIKVDVMPLRLLRNWALHFFFILVFTFCHLLLHPSSSFSATSNWHVLQWWMHSIPQGGFPNGDSSRPCLSSCTM